MTIGELAKKADVNAQTIRYYERNGLLTPAYRLPDSGYRNFDDEAWLRLRFIKSAKDLGFTLREIKELFELRILPRESCQEMESLLTLKLKDVDRRLAEMRRIRRFLVHSIDACQKRDEPNACPALSAIEHYLPEIKE